jgi:hypothetical protein
MTTTTASGSGTVITRPSTSFLMWFRATETAQPARDAFDALGVTPWGERARQELRAAGETGRRRERGALSSSRATVNEAVT